MIMAYKLEETEKAIKSVSEKIKTADALIDKLNDVNNGFINASQSLETNQGKIETLFNQQKTMYDEIVVKIQNTDERSIKFIESSFMDIQKHLISLEQSIKTVILELHIGLDRKNEKLIDQIDKLRHEFEKELFGMKELYTKQGESSKNRYIISGIAFVVLTILTIVGILI